MQSNKKQTVREYFGEKGCQKMRDRLEEFFDSKGGFVFVYTPPVIKGEKGKASDMFKDVDFTCITDTVTTNLIDAVMMGLIKI
jgi:hypothetical protein